MKRVVSIVILINSITCNCYSQITDFILKQSFNECFILDTIKDFDEFDTIKFTSDLGNYCTCYLEKGKLTRTFMKHRMNSVTRELNYFNGKLHGFGGTYNQDGFLIVGGYYLNDTLITPSFYSYDNGRPQIIWYNNKKICFAKNGKIVEIITDTFYKNTDSKYYQFYHSNGQPACDYMHHHGIITPYKEYYETGILKSEGFYKFYNYDYEFDPNDTIPKESGCLFYTEHLKVGMWQEFHSNGVIRLISNYKEEIESREIKNGRWQYFDEKGNLIKEELWDNNVLKN